MATSLALFGDRREAGRRLAAELGKLALDDPLVLALPRGGVPVAFEVARALDAQLDLLIVRKIGAPGHEEFGIGAVVDGADPQCVMNNDIVRMIRPDPDRVRIEIDRQLAELERRRRAYLGDAEPVSVTGRTVIAVDDGIATGGTVKAALMAIRRNDPAELILAVPVAPPDSLAALAPLCDRIVCPYRPDPFYAVGVHYRDFRQVDDAEVIDLFTRSRRAG